jgi:phytoene dehydrogenase-like protein
MFVPFEDGSSIQLWEDDARCDEEVRRFAPGDLKGWRAFCAFRGSIRDALRPPGDDDLWLGPAPSREEIEGRLGHDRDRIAAVFEWSMVEFVERYLRDERLVSALLGQGVIGTFASPFEAGTASIHLHHNSGRQGGMPGTWGYVEGGMGRVSRLLYQAATGAGAVVCAGVPVARVIPGAGVCLEGGERIESPVVVSNADPVTTLRLLGDEADPAWRARVEAVPIEGATLKLNIALRELPNFTSRPGTKEPHHRGQINTPMSKAEWQAAYLAARAGRLPERVWTELYFQTSYDATIAPAGVHTMSVFAQYVPNRFAVGEGTWDTRREEAGDLAVAAIARFCSNIPEAISQRQTLGPVDIEREVGLTGGHIFQGEMLPAQMWSNRLGPGTPMAGVYLCGAATYPGGSVIAVNGRNAALAVLREGSVGG